MAYLIYPDNLPGLAYSIVRRPKHNVSVQTHQSGGEVRMSYWSLPLWEWDLTYELLRDGFRNGRNYTELKQIEGLFLASTGSLNGFQFRDHDDNQVFRQFLGNTTSNPSPSLVRFYGAGIVGVTEPVGFLDTTQPFNLYVDSSAAPVDISDPIWGYTLSLATPLQQQVIFNNTPPAGHDLFADFSYLFYARFQSDSQDFEKFMHGLWSLKKVTLQSLRW